MARVERTAETWGMLSRGGTTSGRSIKLDEEQFEQLKMHFAEALALPPKEAFWLFGELADQYLATRPTDAATGWERRLVANMWPLFCDSDDTLTSRMVSTFLAGLKFAPQTVNKVRNTGAKIVDMAIANRRWDSGNPFKLASRRKEPRRKYETLTLEELGRVQAQLPPDRRREFRMCLHLGLRTGELFALQKEDVDLRAGSILIRRSHGRHTTKTGRERVIPILPAIAGDLQEAMRLAPGSVIFPRPGGQKRREDTKMTRLIRTAMVRAGVGIDYAIYKCRRHGCGHREGFESHTLRRPCSKCGFLLQAIPVVKPFRWYDLRHACATENERAGAKTLAIALLLGHSVRNITQGTYVHLGPADLALELSRWHLPF